MKLVTMVKASVCCVPCGMLIPTTSAAEQTKSAQMFSRGVVKQEVATSDISHVRAGTPRQLIIPRRAIFGTFEVKVRA